MSNPALWVAIAGCISAVASLITAARAHSRATDAHHIALGHALDRSWHPGAPARIRRPPVDLAGPTPPEAEAPPAAGPTRM
jgi:hypothetical protein